MDPNQKPRIPQPKVTEICDEATKKWHQEHCPFSYDASQSDSTQSTFVCQHGIQLPPVFEDTGAGG